MDKCRFYSESMYAYLQLINLSTIIHGPPPNVLHDFSWPTPFSCTKMMAHPHFFSSPPPPVLYDQSLRLTIEEFRQEQKKGSVYILFTLRNEFNMKW